MLIEGNGILITSVQDWFDSAPPKGGADHWVSGRVVRDGLEAMALVFSRGPLRGQWSVPQAPNSLFCRENCNSLKAPAWSLSEADRFVRNTDAELCERRRRGHAGADLRF